MPLAVTGDLVLDVVRGALRIVGLTDEHLKGIRLSSLGTILDDRVGADLHGGAAGCQVEEGIAAVGDVGDIALTEIVQALGGHTVPLAGGVQRRTVNEKLEIHISGIEGSYGLLDAGNGGLVGIALGDILRGRHVGQGDVILPVEGVALSVLGDGGIIRSHGMSLGHSLLLGGHTGLGALHSGVEADVCDVKDTGAITAEVKAEIVQIHALHVTPNAAGIHDHRLPVARGRIAPVNVGGLHGIGPLNAVGAAGVELAAAIFGSAVLDHDVAHLIRGHGLQLGGHGLTVVDEVGVVARGGKGSIALVGQNIHLGVGGAAVAVHSGVILHVRGIVDLNVAGQVRSLSLLLSEGRHREAGKKHDDRQGDSQKLFHIPSPFFFGFLHFYCIPKPRESQQKF